MVAEGLTFTEAPRWHDGALWFVDFFTESVNRVETDGEVERIATVPGRPSGLGWLPDGDLLVVSMTERRLLRLSPGGTPAEHADLSTLGSGHANDMVVGEDGRAYVGFFGFDADGGAAVEPATLAMVDPDGTARVVADGLWFPNGMAITPDRQTLLVNELFGNRVSAFAIRADGTLGPREDWASFGDLGDERDMLARLASATIAPDGLAYDAEGAVWVADSIHQRAVRIAEGGEVLDEVSSRPEQTFAVALGGERGTTLFCCVAPDPVESARRTAREGRILAVEVDAAGAGTP